MMGYWDGKKCRYEDEKDEKWKVGSRLKVAEAQTGYL